VSRGGDCYGTAIRYSESAKASSSLREMAQVFEREVPELNPVALQTISSKVSPIEMIHAHRLIDQGIASREGNRRFA
jgi:hypothetical protein